MTAALYKFYVRLKTISLLFNTIAGKESFLSFISLLVYNGIVDRYIGLVDRYNKIVDYFNEIVGICRYNEIVDGYNGMVDRHSGIVNLYTEI